MPSNISLVTAKISMVRAQCNVVSLAMSQRGLPSPWSYMGGLLWMPCAFYFDAILTIWSCAQTHPSEIVLSVFYHLD